MTTNVEAQVNLLNTFLAAGGEYAKTAMEYLANEAALSTAQALSIAKAAGTPTFTDAAGQLRYDTLTPADAAMLQNQLQGFYQPQPPAGYSIFSQTTSSSSPPMTGPENPPTGMAKFLDFGGSEFGAYKVAAVVVGGLILYLMVRRG